MEILHFHWINKFGIFLATIPNNLNTKTFISEYIELNINYLDQAVEIIGRRQDDLLRNHHNGTRTVNSEFQIILSVRISRVSIKVIKLSRNSNADYILTGNELLTAGVCNYHVLLLVTLTWLLVFSGKALQEKQHYDVLRNADIYKMYSPQFKIRFSWLVSAWCKLEKYLSFPFEDINIDCSWLHTYYIKSHILISSLDAKLVKVQLFFLSFHVGQ